MVVALRFLCLIIVMWFLDIGSFRLVVLMVLGLFLLVLRFRRMLTSYPRRREAKRG